MTLLADLRKSYEKAELDEGSAPHDPLVLFQRWLDEAIAVNVPEPNAMTLATVGSDGRPSTRVQLIKGLDARGIVWYTNYQGRKGHELAQNPFGALQFHWVELERVCALKAASRKSVRPTAMPITKAARWIHASALGHRPKAKSSAAAWCW